MVQIRAARPSDYEVFAALFPELGTNDPIPSRDVWERSALSDTLVLEHEGAVQGYVYVQILDGTGYVRHVVVGPRARGMGYGRRLLEHVARMLRENGCEEWCLNVMPDNMPAVRLYTRLGMKQRHASAALRMTWSVRERLPSPPLELVVERLELVHDGEAEATFELPRGLLAHSRSRAGSHLFRATSRGSTRGLAVFQPTFPGAFPFRAESVEVARALLDTMILYADRRRDWLQLVFEDAPALQAAFLDAGATSYLEFVHFKGIIPTDG